MTLEEFLNGLTEEEEAAAQDILEKNPDISVRVLAKMLSNNIRKPVP
jgi:hypothetical protein